MGGIRQAALCCAMGILICSAAAESKSRDNRLKIDVGPIWNQADAESKCRKAARKAGGEWLA
jgi:hypothetical protein